VSLRLPHSQDRSTCNSRSPSFLALQPRENSEPRLRRRLSCGASGQLLQALLFFSASLRRWLLLSAARAVAVSLSAMAIDERSQRTDDVEEFEFGSRTTCLG
jgi:hypothetical protein